MLDKIFQMLLINLNLDLESSYRLSTKIKNKIFLCQYFLSLIIYQIAIFFFLLTLFFIEYLVVP